MMDISWTSLWSSEHFLAALAVTTASGSAWLKMLKLLVKVFKSLYLLNLWMDLVDTDVRYWSEVLWCTIMTHISDLEVKVTDIEILKFLDVYIFWSISWILLILCLMLDTHLKLYAAPSPPPH